MILDLIATLGSLIVPPAFDFIKKKFTGADEDTPERTISSLASTKPEVVADYVKSVVELKDADIKFFNRDVLGTPAMWVVNLRASIRPMAVIMSLTILIGMVVMAVAYNDEFIKMTTGPGADMISCVRLSCESMVSSWFGSRISLSSK